MNDIENEFGLTQQKIAEIELCYDIGSDFSDGAWWALCGEHGVDADDLVAYHEWKNQKEVKS